MLYSSLAKWFPILPDNSCPMVPNQPAINNPQSTAEFPCACISSCSSPQPFCRPWATTHTRAYLGLLNITHTARQKALARHARLAPAAALTNPAGKGAQWAWATGETRTWGQEVQAERSLGSWREPLGGKAKEPKLGRRCGNHGKLCWGFSEGGVGTAEHVSSGSGWVTHTLELSSAQAQPEAQRDEVLSSCRGRSQAPRTLKISTTTNAATEAFLKYFRDAFIPKYFRDAFSHTPRWVTPHHLRSWQRGSLSFLTSARLTDIGNYFPNSRRHILAPGPPLPTALQYAQPGPNCHVFIYPVLRTFSLWQCSIPGLCQPHSSNYLMLEEKKPIEMLLFKHN